MNTINRKDLDAMDAFALKLVEDTYRDSDDASERTVSVYAKIRSKMLIALGEQRYKDANRFLNMLAFIGDECMNDTGNFEVFTRDEEQGGL